VLFVAGWPKAAGSKERTYNTPEFDERSRSRRGGQLARRRQTYGYGVEFTKNIKKTNTDVFFSAAEHLKLWTMPDKFDLVS
jgi:hypothetical protein